MIGTRSFTKCVFDLTFMSTFQASRQFGCENRDVKSKYLCAIILIRMDIVIFIILRNVYENMFVSIIKL